MMIDLVDDESYLPLPESFHSKNKMYYGMGETCAMFHLPASTLRFWEKEFDWLKPRKNGKGDRFFSKNDIVMIRTIYYLTRVKGYTLQGAKEVMKAQLIREADTATIIACLNDIKTMLLKIKTEL